MPFAIRNRGMLMQANGRPAKAVGRTTSNTNYNWLVDYLDQSGTVICARYGVDGIPDLMIQDWDKAGRLVCELPHNWPMFEPIPREVIDNITIKQNSEEPFKNEQQLRTWLEHWVGQRASELGRANISNADLVTLKAENKRLQELVNSMTDNIEVARKTVEAASAELDKQSGDGCRICGVKREWLNNGAWLQEHTDNCPKNVVLAMMAKVWDQSKVDQAYIEKLMTGPVVGDLCIYRSSPNGAWGPLVTKLVAIQKDAYEPYQFDTGFNSRMRYARVASDKEVVKYFKENPKG